MSLKARISTAVSMILSSALDLGSADAKTASDIVQSYVNGTGSNQANSGFSDRRALTASQAESLDLAGGLTAALGGSITFTKIKEIIVTAPKSNTGDLRVGKSVANAFVGPFGAAATGVLLPPGGIIHLRAPLAGWTVTAGTGDLLQVENLVAADASYDIILVGIV